MSDSFSAAWLTEGLQEARARTLALVNDLNDEQLMGPRLEIVNPLLWEIGHVAWFQENFVLRQLHGLPPLLENGDYLYDSSTVAHDDRWDLPLLDREATLRYMQDVQDRLLERLAAAEPDERETYSFLLALFHEDMHDEAFTYTRQTLGYAAPRFGQSGFRPASGGAGPLAADVVIPAGTLLLGGTPDMPFVFDNERWGHEVEVPAFAIARAPVTEGEFAAFVDDGGYDRRECWDEAGWRWREESAVSVPAQPCYWKRDGDRWLTRRFDRWTPIGEHLPMLHVNWYEARAFCSWAGRRLPTEAEWEMAASASKGPGAAPKRSYPWGSEEPTPQHANLDWHYLDQHRACGLLEAGDLPESDSAHGCRQLLGGVWEWTSNSFEPFPGFAPGPYADYSKPWFGGTHKVLRGGCWATRSRLIRNTYRNYYPPHRRDVFAGFRTCAPPA